MRHQDEAERQNAGDSADTDINRLTGILERGYAAKLPASREAAIASALRMRIHQRPGPTHQRHIFPWVHVPVLPAIALLITTSVVIAAAGIVNLGRPAAVQSTNAYFPLSGFHRIGQPVLLRHKAQVLFIGTLSGDDVRSALERWAVVKALQQFGSLTGVRAVDRNCRFHTVVGPCTLPTFDWSHARYRSSYVVFDHKDLLGLNNKPYQRLSGRDLSLYNRYARIGRSPFKTDHYDAFNTVLKSSSGNTARGLPLITVGGYLQTSSQVLSESDLAVPGTPVPNNPQAYVQSVVLNFSAVHDSLLHGKDPVASHLVEDVNAEANILTALICHADRNRPGNVCGRQIIRAISRHVR